jgi:hypothetical protein
VIASVGGVESSIAGPGGDPSSADPQAHKKRKRMVSEESEILDIRVTDLPREGVTTIPPRGWVRRGAGVADASETLVGRGPSRPHGARP